MHLFSLTLFVFLLAGTLTAQPFIHNMPDTSKTKSKNSEPQEMHHHGMKPEMQMPSAFFPQFPMARDGSGTSWHPDNTKMYGFHTQSNNWYLMLHGSVNLRYTAQDVFENGSRGDSEFDAPNWIMAMAHRQFGKGQWLFRGMFTAEPITEGKYGFPLLFQTGETIDDKALIDRQHPHDLFAELSVAYTHAFNDEVGASLYLAYPGEPAVGPPAFMHRPSSRHIPGPPIAHHWQDATHITFGVATIGIRHQNLKFESSLFTGREPNEERYGLDKLRMDSYAFRISANPGKKLAFQISRAFFKSPTILAPKEDQWRTTASILYNDKVGQHGFLSGALIWGLLENAGEVNLNLPSTSNKTASLNVINKIHHASVSGELHSFLLELDLQIKKYAFFSRMEFVEKSPADLGFQTTLTNDISVGTLSLGVSRELFKIQKMILSLNVMGTLYKVPGDLTDFYGSQPFSLDVYLNLGMPLMQMHSH